MNGVLEKNSCSGRRYQSRREITWRSSHTHSRSKENAINLNGCKLYAFQVNDAVGALISHFKEESMDIDYLVSADTSVIPPRYTVWLECDGKGSDITATEASAIIEGHLKSANLEYAGSVEDGIIGQLALKLLKPGTRADVKHILKHRSAVGEIQMKLPRVVWDTELLDLLASRTINGSTYGGSRQCCFR